LAGQYGFLLLALSGELLAVSRQLSVFSFQRWAISARLSLNVALIPLNCESVFPGNIS
jgi:hypothetical protein